MNQIAQMLNIPTFPLSDGMLLRTRSMREYQYLIEHGVFMLWCGKKFIVKQNGKYRLYTNTGPIAELELECNTLDEMIKFHDVPIGHYRWHPTYHDGEWEAYLGCPEKQTSEKTEDILEVKSV